MRLGRLVKEKQVRTIQDFLGERPFFYMVSFSKIPTKGFNALRTDLRSKDAKLLVIKNRFLKICFRNLGIEGLDDFVEGPTGLILLGEDPVGPSKVLVDFSKEFEGLKIQAGFLNNKVLNKSEVEALSKLPGIEVLRAQLVGLMKSPINNIVYTLKNVINKFVWALDAVRKDKEEKGSG